MHCRVVLLDNHPPNYEALLAAQTLQSWKGSWGHVDQTMKRLVLQVLLLKYKGVDHKRVNYITCTLELNLNQKNLSNKSVWLIYLGIYRTGDKFMHEIFMNICSCFCLLYLIIVPN